MMSTNTTTNNFTQIQSRRFRSTTLFPCYKLCPSMDLIVLGQTSSSTVADNATTGGNNNIAESIVVHRIISWSNLLTIKIDCLSSSSSSSRSSSFGEGSSGSGICVEDIERECIHDNNINDMMDEDEDDYDDDLLLKGATSVTWSPNGRYVAIGLVDGGVLIHTVEPDAAAEAGSMVQESVSIGSAAGGCGGDGRDGNVALHIIKPPPFNSSNKPSILSPTASSAISVAAVGGGDANKRNKKPTPSPRVTRSMAAAREGGGTASSSAAGGGSSGMSRKKSSRRSKSPHSSRGSSSSALLLLLLSLSIILPRLLLSCFENK